MDRIPAVYRGLPVFQLTESGQKSIVYDEARLAE